VCSSDLPDLHATEFSGADLIESALAAVRKTADETGVQVQTRLVGQAPERVHGSSQHLHQLITMLAASLSDIGRADSLEVQAAFEVKQGGDAELQLSLFVASAGCGETLFHRLKALTEGSASLRSVRCGGPELGLTGAWQLALAMGGRPSVLITGEQKVGVEISLPLPANAAVSSENGIGLAVIGTNGECGRTSDSVPAPVVGCSESEH
jgi:hypothetical protein